MRIVAVLFAVFLALSGPSVAQEARNSNVEATIQSQIDAFLVDDFVTAFTFAAPSIQSMFQTPENFGRMVREGYPMVWRPSEVRFLEFQTQGQRVFQKVLMRDARGTPHVLEYSLIETGDGWRINGVRILPSPDVGA